jgi:hypothetical protein
MNPLILNFAIWPFIPGMWAAMVILAIPFLQRLFVALGVGFVVFTGYQLLFDQIKGYIYGAFSGAPANMIALVEIARVDDAANMILSAYSVRLLIKLVNGSKRVMQLKA